ncbi:MAG: (2Fe-2S)-binding protein [Hyphomicrobiales bacterium]|nr:2Fe-2S iron-sulfur cluster binding domain-containing protein [Hyphomicrobiales bacterium]PCH51549.1 MAG: (2Fe-2S)-binding protein [Hyphomicrobiales bacterium]
MTEVIFVSANGEKTTVEANAGDTVMQTALAANISDIIAECGGAMMCATCHVYVDDDWLERVGKADEDELTMLDFASSEVKPTSRLSCQIKVDDENSGMIIHLPDSQL